MNAYRRAAIVVASLDRRAADDLLERLPDEQARAIRDELVLLDEPNENEQQYVIEEYLQPASSENELSLNVSDEQADASCPPPEEEVVEQKPQPHVEHGELSPVLRELLSQDDSTLAAALKYERASIVSALLHRLPQRRAAGVLRGLPPQLQWRVLANLDHGQRASHQMVDVIADRLCEKHAEHAETLRSDQQEDALQAIFTELSLEERREMLRSLAEENPMLAQRLVPKLPTSALSNDCYC